MIRQRNKFSFSEFFYAIDFSAMKHGPDTGNGCHFVSVPAIWFKRKSGWTAVCSGSLSAFATPEKPIYTPDDFMKEHDGRYGGSTAYKWDGSEMWGSENHWDGLVKAHDRLDPLLEAFEQSQDVPQGFDGWFSIK